MVHGFGAHSYDMQRLKRTIEYYNFGSILYCSESNQDDTTVSILQLGKNLAEEVITFINQNCHGVNLEKISFVGHSMGGLIVRTALPYLVQYKK